jgi:uncharacterized protein (DUF1778 family)
MPGPRQRPSAIRGGGRAGRSLMVRLDEESKQSLSDAAKLRGISLSDYVREVTVPQARREVLAARERALAMTPDEQLAFWDALDASAPLTESQERLGAIMRGDA